MFDQKKTPVKTLPSSLIGSLMVVMLISGCGGEQPEVTGDTSGIEERVRKVGGVNTDAPVAAAEAPTPEAVVTEAAAQADTTTAEAPVATVAPAEVEPAPATAATVAAGGAIDGKAIYNKACLACHLAGVANAPKLGDKAAWEPRIAKGMDALMQSAINGIPGTAMPARGTCTTCSDEELKAAIVYMTGQ